MMEADAFEQFLTDLRPRLHRYCARMIGSAIDGEDVVQDVLVKALAAHGAGAAIERPEAWVFRIAHNACLDALRSRARRHLVPITDDVEAAAESHPQAARVSFRVLMRLPVLQRSVVILKDVLGHSVAEAAEVAGCSAVAAKAALQRGRTSLRALAEADDRDDVRLPLLSKAERDRLERYVALFQAGDFDAIRAQLADDVRLDLVNRLELRGPTAVGLYFTRYAEADHWRFALGAVEGRAAMLVFDGRRDAEGPAHVALLDWRDGKVAGIRDFLFAPYVVEEADWVRLG